MDTFVCWHLPIFTPRRQSTIFGTTELNFCVRYGNRWTLSVINTNYLFSTTNMILSHKSAFVNSFFKIDRFIKQYSGFALMCANIKARSYI